MTIRGGKLRSFGEVATILGKEGLHDLGFNIPGGEITARRAIMRNRIEEELPSTSTSDVSKADDIELQEITTNAAKVRRISSSNSRVNPQRIYPCASS